MQLRITVGVLLFEERQVHCEGDIQREHNWVGCPSSVFCGEPINIRGPVMNIVNVWIPREGESNMAKRGHCHGDGETMRRNQSNSKDFVAKAVGEVANHARGKTFSNFIHIVRHKAFHILRSKPERSCGCWLGDVSRKTYVEASR